MNEHFRFAPDIFVRLGEELIPNPEQGIIELVKNSYDADAQTCTVKLDGTDTEGGTILISDDGVGMDMDAISNGWLVLGRSTKVSEREPTRKFGRLPVGDKGIGRLAALRQGSQATLTTRPEKEPGIEYCLTIDWNRFDRVDVVEDVLFEIERRETSRKRGTDIIIHNLHFKLGKRAVQRLARELVLLADPFENRFGFYPELVAPGFSELEELVRNAYFEDAEYRLKARLNSEGRAEAWLLDWKGEVLFHGDYDDLSKQPYETATAHLDLWAFLLKGKQFSARKASLTEVREWLRVVGGVHLYHRGLRVRPYGDEGHDWLEMNLARARSPEERPSTNTSIGKVVVDDPDDLLVQKTDRIGFIEDRAFSELRRFAIDSLDWMAKERLKVAERRRQRERIETARNIDKVREELNSVIEDAVPEEGRQAVKRTVKKYERTVKRNIKSLREDLQIYRSLATAGTTAAVFAHESSRPITLLTKVAKRIEDQGQKLLDSRYSSILEQPVAMLYQIAGALENFARFPLHLLKREKRRSGSVDVHDVIDDMVRLFQPFFDDAAIDVVTEKVGRKLYIYGSVALLEAILANLLTNTINAFNVEGARNEGRKVVIRTELSRDHMLLRVLDNGPGIKGIGLDEIWLPGRTTTRGGTGFGLTIVKDSVTDLDGEVHAIANGELGGAELVVRLPLVRG